jgi:hypothetical protein
VLAYRTYGLNFYALTLFSSPAGPALALTFYQVQYGVHAGGKYEIKKDAKQRGVI